MGTNGTGRRNRSWPEALKREIVAASFAPGSSVSKVARHYDVNANQVFGWRKRYRDEAGAPAVRSASQLIPVVVMAEPDAVVTQPSTAAAAIEIDLAGKYRVRVGGGVEAEALRRGIFGAVAAVFGVAVLALAEVAGWQALRLKFQPIPTTLILSGSIW